MNNLTITGAVFKKIAPSLSDVIADQLATVAVAVCAKYDINTVQRFCAFIANCTVESGGFAVKTENLNYSFPRIYDIFKTHFKDQEESKLFVHKPEELANRVYADRNGNGNEPSGDGYEFRGGGFLQLTGRAMYQAYADYIAKTIDEAAELVRTDNYYALDSAAWCFAVVKQLNDEADKGDMKTICMRINGGLNGYPERLAAYAVAMKYYS